jgi:hypothetical protein
MTAMTTSATRPRELRAARPGLIGRVLAVARMQLADRRTVLISPVAVLALVFVINIVIWQLTPVSGRHTGGAASIVVYLTVVAVICVARGLPFALGMGSSRRAFVLGTLAAGGLLATAFGVLLFVLQRVERTSDGWGMHGNFFWYPWFDRSPAVADVLVLVLALLAAFALGGALASCWSRWSTLALVAGVPALLAILGGAAIVLTWRGWWHDLGGWLAGQTPLTATGWCALAAVLLTGASYLVLRRVRA